MLCEIHGAINLLILGADYFFIGYFYKKKQKKQYFLRKSRKTVS